MRTADVEDGQPRPSRRERVRATTVEEIKTTALELIGRHGTAGLRFSDIAADMGFTAPALYRYFADRDELLTALVADSYVGLTAALTAARDECSDDVGDRLRAACVAYRVWAAANPQRFALIFGAPVPGYAAPPDGPTHEAGRSTMAHIAELFADADRVGRLAAPAAAASEPVPAAEGEFELPPETMDAVLLAWSTVHGFVSLETYGHFHSLDQQARDRLFEVQVHNAASVAGLMPPPGTRRPGTPQAGRTGRLRTW